MRIRRTSPRTFTPTSGAQVLNKKLSDASVSRIHIERAARRANITIHTARPGIVIGKKGEDIEKLRTAVAKILGMTMNDVRLNIAEIRKPELDAKLVAEGIGSSWKSASCSAAP
jgi:small subunit ribosomal protein S3